jgi:hypothetical protein
LIRVFLQNVAVVLIISITFSFPQVKKLMKGLKADSDEYLQVSRISQDLDKDLDYTWGYLATICSTFFNLLSS